MVNGLVSGLPSGLICVGAGDGVGVGVAKAACVCVRVGLSGVGDGSGVEEVQAVITNKITAEVVSRLSALVLVRDISALSQPEMKVN